MTRAMRWLRARPFAGFAAALFLALTLSRAVSSELFLDGVTYASISRNLAEGRGSFWSLWYTEFSSPFWMHPPLAFWLQSLGYRAFGDRTWVELYWGVAAGALSLGLVAGLWRQTWRGWAGPGEEGLGWWPAVLLLSAPLWSWCLANNLLENTLLPFLLAAVALALASMRAERWPRRILWAVAAGGASFCAVLTKGPPGLFALVAPLCAAVFLGRTSLGRTLASWAAMVGALAACVGLCAWVGGAEARAFVAGYFDGQLRSSYLGAAEVAPSRWYLAQVLATQAALPLGLPLVTGRARAGASEAERRVGAFFLALGVCASLPFFVFVKQMEWYLVPSLPFYALGLGALFRERARRLEHFVAGTPRRLAALWAVSALLASAGVGVAAGWPGAIQLGFAPTVRGLAQRAGLVPPANEGTSEYCWRNFYRDVLSQGVVLPPDEQVSSCARNSEWRLVAYLQRHYRASLLPGNGARWLLIELDTGESCSLRSDCAPLQREPTERFVLYQCASGNRAARAVTPPPSAQ